MKQIPQDIDRTLWAIAESNDVRAIDEFGERYPAYKAELVARINLVRTLKADRPYREAPYLHLPQRGARQPRFGRGVGLALAGAVMATLAFATIVTVKPWSRPAAPPQQAPVPIDVTPPKRDTGDLKVDERWVMPKHGQDSQEPLKQEVKSEPATPMERLVQIDRENVKLSQVLNEIAQQSKLRIEVAPGTEDVLVSAKYLGVSAQDALTDLGQNFGFTPVQQEENHILIVPALDPSRSPVTVPQGSFSEPSDTPGQSLPLVQPGMTTKH
jgi:hypothetical protein